MCDLLFIFLATPNSMWDFSSQPGIEPCMGSMVYQPLGLQESPQ